MTTEKKTTPTTTNMDKLSTKKSSVSDLIQELIANVSPNVLEKLRESISVEELDVSNIAKWGLKFRQAVDPLRVTAVAPAYKYGSDGNRTDEVRGMYVTCAAFGGSIRVLIEGADEETFAGLSRGTRMLLVEPEVRVGVNQSGKSTTLYVSAAGLEVVS